MRKIVRVFILADGRIYREALANALASCHDLVVIGAAPSDGANLERVAGGGIDVVVTDGATFPHRGPAPWPSNAGRDLKVVVIGIPHDEQEVLASVDLGAAGYVPADASPDELVATVLSVASGEFRHPPYITGVIVNRLRCLTAARLCSPAERVLSLREKQVLELMERGLSNKGIARSLGIEVSTVKNHVHHILAKVHAERRGQAVALFRGSLLRTGNR